MLINIAVTLSKNHGNFVVFRRRGLLYHTMLCLWVVMVMVVVVVVEVEKVLNALMDMPMVLEVPQNAGV